MLLLFLLCLFCISRPKKRKIEIKKYKIKVVNYDEIKRRAKKERLKRELAKLSRRKKLKEQKN
jgi:hypothetical protein